MILEYVSSYWLVQFSFIVGIAVVIIAVLFKARSEKAQYLEIADRKNARTHEANMWQAKQGAIEHKP